MGVRFYEHINRSIAKAFTFRLVILVSDAIIIFAITHRYDLTIGVMIFSNIASTALYILHERFWNGIHWGKHNKAKS